MEKPQPNREPHYDDYYEIDLREYITLLWEGKALIIGLFIVAVLAAGIISQYFIAPVYQTEAQMLAPTFNLSNEKQLDSDDYLSFLKSPKLGQKVINKFKLDKDKENFTVENLNKMLSVSSKKDSNLVTVTLESNDPQLAKKILSYWIKLFQQNVDEFIENHNNSYFRNLKQNMESSKEEYNTALNKWTSFNQKVNLNLLTSQLQERESRLSTFEIKKSDLQNNIEKLTAGYKEIQQMINNTDKFIVTREQISDSSLRKLKAIINDEDILENLITENESLSPQYSNLMNIKNKIQQKLTTNKAELNSLTNEIDKLQKEIPKLQSKVAQYQKQKGLLKDKLNMTRQNYQEGQLAYNQAMRELSQKNYQIDIVKQTIVPENPISPNKKLNVAIAGVLALMLGVFIVFFKEFMAEESIVETTSKKA
ncbi:GumC family protein [Selenihalanaerobacter shriftii]|uniref:Uncharacterized protein involved in exopolysaccharide biosynthesis n=1 Tax=Selenihalanaerobacter shriftii TaxID=142842 RepID=A0A1T4QIZ8_9FIRM|nr:Wzz/FepE/Etk N-terminal domain-containing protein [Selenihalanaerobacter shriftii]SKA03662.1 Uncharacterized protein involved in exopolysaccharide biosynthesis [Selenihalanaerobacter shriftii]